ncbi:hypothetical protein BH24CHL6_BH24CHL6_00650 [soil metagenome]
MDRAAFQRWLDAYVEAWQTYDARKIGNLFSEDAEYRYHPQDEPVRGRAAIVASWLDERDPPDSYEARYEPLAIDGDVYVAQGSSRYFDAQGQLRDEYCNIYVCRFDDAGRCTQFTEYWIQSRDFARREREQAGSQTTDG